MKDEELLNLYWNRNEDAISETAKRYGGYLTKIAGNILSDFYDTEECVNDTYLRAWNSIPPNCPKVLSLYLAKITRQLAIDVFRRRHAGKRMASQYAASLEELGDSFTDGISAEDPVMAKALRDSVTDFVRQLSADTRAVFVGRYFYFDTIKEISSYCGMAEGTVKSTLYRTRLALKNHLKTEGFDV